MRTKLLSFGCIVPFVVLAVWSQSNVLTVNLINEDQYATRMMKVKTAAGENLRGISLSFDATSKAFLIRSGGGDRTVPLADLSQIEFTQELRRQSPVAQAAPWKITAKPGRLATYEIPQQGLKLENGLLTLLPDWEQPDASSAGRGAAEVPSLSGGVTAREIAEPTRLTYEAATTSFQIQLQYVQYSKVTTGGSGIGVSGGVTKPQQ